MKKKTADESRREKRHRLQKLRTEDQVELTNPQTATEFLNKMRKDKNKKFTQQLVKEVSEEEFEETSDESDCPDENPVVSSKGDLIIIQLVVGGENKTVTGFSKQTADEIASNFC